MSQRTHTVTSDSGLFDSGHVLERRPLRVPVQRGRRLSLPLHDPPEHRRRDRRPARDARPASDRHGAGRRSRRVDGRTADPTARPRPASVVGSSFTTIASATPAPNGTWKATIDAEATGDYRAVSGTGASESRRLLVGVRRVHVSATRSGVHVAVTPSAPYAPFLVEVHLRERFGWWPVRARAPRLRLRGRGLAYAALRACGSCSSTWTAGRRSRRARRSS